LKSVVGEGLLLLPVIVTVCRFVNTAQEMLSIIYEIKAKLSQT
jgi:hypothetical protein